MIVIFNLALYFLIVIQLFCKVTLDPTDKLYSHFVAVHFLSSPPKRSAVLGESDCLLPELDCAVNILLEICAGIKYAIVTMDVICYVIVCHIISFHPSSVVFDEELRAYRLEAIYAVLRAEHDTFAKSIAYSTRTVGIRQNIFNSHFG